MKVLNYGSLNFDHVYAVDHMVCPGETQSSFRMETHFGGKGLNQSIALARAGADTYHAGMIGEDGASLLAICKDQGVDVSNISMVRGRSGHAIIQVNTQGENCILLYRGANGANTKEKIESVLSQFEAGDILVLQNEINLLDEIVEVAYARGLKIVLNPSPMNEAILACDLHKVSLFLLNEVEGAQIAGEEDPNQVLEKMHEMYPNADILLTLGKQGCCYLGKEGRFTCPSFQVEAVDTTAAGDTFTGYFLASMLQGKEIQECMRRASAASALAVTRQGAVPSIPQKEEVDEFLATHA
jgi:ribokinase